MAIRNVTTWRCTCSTNVYKEKAALAGEVSEVGEVSFRNYIHN